MITVFLEIPETKKGVFPRLIKSLYGYNLKKGWELIFFRLKYDYSARRPSSLNEWQFAFFFWQTGLFLRNCE